MSKKKHFKRIPFGKSGCNHGNEKKNGRPIARGVFALSSACRQEQEILCTSCIRNQGTKGRGINLTVICGEAGKKGPARVIYAPRNKKCSDFMGRERLEAFVGIKTVAASA